MMGLGIYDTLKMPHYMSQDEYNRLKNETVNGLLSSADTSYLDRSTVGNGMKDPFHNSKLEELLNRFGKRMCKSDIVFGSELEDDPRKIRTWPCLDTPATPTEPPKPFTLQFTMPDGEEA